MSNKMYECPSTRLCVEVFAIKTIILTGVLVLERYLDVEQKECSAKIK